MLDLRKIGRGLLASIAALAMVALVFGSGMPAARAANPITIGFSMPLSGPYAVSGRQALIAMKIWEHDVNAKGGLLGRPVKFVYYDDESNPAKVPGIYTKLLDVDHVDLIVGPYGTVLTAPAMPTAIEHHMVLISLVSLNLNKRFHYARYFSPTPLGLDPIVDFSKGFFHVAMEQTPKPKTLAIIAADQEFSAQNVAGALKNAKAAGLKVVYKGTYPPSTTDYAPMVRAAQAANPDIVYVASYPPGSVGIVRAMHEIGFKPKMFGGAMVGLQITTIQQHLGPLLNGTVAFNAWEPLKPMLFPGVMKMLDQYQKEAKGKGVDPLGYFLAPAAYAYVQILGEAVEGAHTLDQAKLAHYIHTHTFDTVDGKFSFDKEGNAVQDRLLQIQFHNVVGHGIAQFKNPDKTMTILWPKNYRTGSLIYPYAKAAK